MTIYSLLEEIEQAAKQYNLADISDSRREEWLALANRCVPNADRLVKIIRVMKEALEQVRGQTEDFGLDVLVDNTLVEIERLANE